MKDSTIEEIKRRVNEERGGLVVQTLDETSSSVTSGLHSGSLRLNEALSGSPKIGYAWGRIVEILGPEMSGKTTLALHAIAQAQKLKYPCAFIDAEHALDPVYAKAIGVDLESLLFNQPDYGEQALQIVIDLVLNGTKVIVVDSVAALTPKAEIEGSMEDANIGLQARIMGRAMRKLAGPIKKNNALVIFLNQIREKVGISFGSPETTPGGKALKFYASYRLDVRAPRGGASKTKGESGNVVETGIDSNVKVVKNKVFPPFRLATVHVEYGIGVDKYIDLVEYIKSKNNKKLIWHGKVAKEKVFLDKLRSDKEFTKKVLQEVLSKDSI